MKTKRSHEGYLLIDHSAGLGLSGLAPRVECPTITCSHCQRVVVINPLRTRARAYCPKCDHYICDECEVVRVAKGGQCITFNEVIDRAQESAIKGVIPTWLNDLSP